MNIQQYYEKTASISLNASIISIIPPFFLIIYGVLIVPSRLAVIAAIPFLIYSFLSYQIYSVNEKWSKSIELELFIPDKGSGSLFRESDILITFLPAPTLRMLFFNKEGFLQGELRDMKCHSIKWLLPSFLDRIFDGKYGLYDQNDTLMAIMKFKNNRIEVLGPDHKAVSVLRSKSSSKRSEIRFYDERAEYLVEKSFLFTDYKFYTNEYKLGRFQKGWMPIEAGDRFKNANTPLLSFEKNLVEGDKLIVFAILANLYRNSNH